MTESSSAAETLAVEDMNVSAVRMLGIQKRFGDFMAVDGVELEVRRGEFFSMLGPSGSGKTTCLRMIAGFEEPTAGRIELNGRDVSGLAPYQRDVNTVFQDYALFPHMTVRENVEYGLRVKKVPRDERRTRALEALDMVRLSGFENRKTNALSGGQRQRVALARALVNRPAVLLLDEPLGALDLKLRQAMQVELKSLQRQVGSTFIYVTHDQEEALSMSDRLAVFNAGKVEQVGAPADVYENPATAFVAGFVGVSNILDGAAAMSVAGDAAPFSIRPEKIELRVTAAEPQEGFCAAQGTVDEVLYLGAITRYAVSLQGGGRLSVLEQNLSTSSSQALAVRGKQVWLRWRREHNRPVARASG